MISGLVLKYLKEAGFVMTKRYETTLPRSSKVILTTPTGFHAVNPALADLRCKDRTEPMPPISHRFMADIDAALMEQIFHIAQ